MSQDIYVWIFLKVTCDEVKILSGKRSTKCEQQYGKKQKVFTETGQPWSLTLSDCFWKLWCTPSSTDFSLHFLTKAFLSQENRFHGQFILSAIALLCNKRFRLYLASPVLACLETQTVPGLLSTCLNQQICPGRTLQLQASPTWVSRRRRRPSPLQEQPDPTRASASFPGNVAAPLCTLRAAKHMVKTQPRERLTQASRQAPTKPMQLFNGGRRVAGDPVVQYARPLSELLLCSGKLCLSLTMKMCGHTSANVSIVNSGHLSTFNCFWLWSLQIHPFFLNLFICLTIAVCLTKSFSGSTVEIIQAHTTQIYLPFYLLVLIQ